MFCGGYTVGQPITLSPPIRVEVELGCDNKSALLLKVKGRVSIT